MAWRNVNRPKIHIEDLSFDAVRRIGMMLDATQDWRILAAELGYGQFEVEELARAPMSLRSSTEQLLQRWRCNKYPTLEEVCAVFIKLGFGGALDIILPELPSDARQRVVDLRTFGSDPPPSYSTSVTPDATEFLEEELPDPPPLTTGGHKPVASNGTADSEPRSEKLKAAPCTSNNPAPQEYVCVPVQSLQSKEIQNLLYSFSDIMTFTNTMECMLDQGTFGKLFKGKKDGKQVVVKMLYRENVKHCDMFLKEVVGLTKFQVPNIVQLLGICMEGPDRYLIYPYYKNGSLKDCLLCKGNRNPLPWSIRCTILIGIANGINYLHNSGNRPFIHGALKSCNVLLDDGLEAQISDLGQAQEVNRGTDGVYTHVTKQSHSETATTVAYLPNEYFTSNRKFSIKTDVYSFGIVALEVGTAMPAFDGEKTLIDIASKAFAPRQSCSSVLKIKDPNCPIWPENLYLKLMEIAEHCTAMQKSDRPIISQVHLDLLTLQDEVEHHIARTMLDNEDPMFPTVSSTDESTSMTSEHPVSSISSDSAEELNKTLQNFHLSSASSTSSLDLGICSKDSDARTAMCSCDYEYDYDEDTVEDCGDEDRECTNTEQSQYSFEGLDLNEPTFQYTNEDAMHQILKEEDLKKCGDEQYKNKSINF